MENDIRQSILKTVLYSDIFDYPLTSYQIWKYLISSRKFKRASFDSVLKNIGSPISTTRGLYFTEGKENIIKEAIKRKKESGKKFVQVYKISRIISFIPFVLFIGVSGGLSMNNAEKKDDIDIFVITKENSIWITRFLIIIILKILGKHRGRRDEKVADKICLNMLIDEKHLSFNSKKQNLYTAHEIVQMVPIFDRNKIHNKFLSKNMWVKKFLQNSIETKNLKIKRNYKNNNLFINLFENFAKLIQLIYLRRHRTIEAISEGWLAFHPLDYNKKIDDAYISRLKQYE